MNIIKITICLYIFGCFNEPCKAFFKNKLKDVINKAKDYYKTKFGKDKTWHFLGHERSEYPGTNEEYRKMNREKWEEYYACLKTQHDNLGEHGSVTPEAVQGFEGNFIIFECKICISPKERSTADSVQWYWAPLGSKGLELVEYTEHILISPQEKSLHIYNLDEEHTGQYICKLGESLTAPYFLTVVNSTENIREVHTKHGKGPHPKQPEQINQYDIMLETEWGPWSSCSRCGKSGKRHRLGYCIIRPIEQTNTTLNEDNKNETSTTTETNENPQKDRVKRSDEITPRDLELLTIFENGIPCRSHILPDSLKNLEEVRSRTSEIEIGYCKVQCPEEQLFVVKDKYGNTIETANNSAGIYSMLQEIPPIEPPVERRLQYGRKGKHIVLSCPGNLNSDAPIQWQIGSKNVIPELLAQESHGRLYVSLMDRINIKKAKISDSSIYSCWQHKELVGTIRLVVEKKTEMTFNHHVMLCGMVIILATFLYCFSKAFLGRKYARIAK